MLERGLWGIICILFFLTCGHAAGQDTVRHRKVKVLPFPDLGYAPETRWYVGAVALVTIPFYQDSATRKSNVKAEAIVTQNRQLVAGLQHNIFLKRNRYYFWGANGFYHFPELFWGLGNQAPDSREELYTARRWEADNTFTRQWIRYVYAGLRYRYQYMYFIKPEAGGLLATGAVSGSRGGTSSGIGYSVVYDSRDNILNASKGWYALFSQLVYRNSWGSDFRFVSCEADIRKYLLVRPGHIVAGQLAAIATWGDAPFRMLALMGGENLMRGYYQGRFRDKNLVAGQLEYRVHVYKAFGLSFFGGAGEVAPSLGGLSFKELKPSYGAGLRIRVDKEDNVNLRFDYAIGKNTTGFYVVYAEAF